MVEHSKSSKCAHLYNDFARFVARVLHDIQGTLIIYANF